MYKVDGTGCNLNCSAVKEHCSSCSDEKTCDGCEEGYYLNDSNKECKSCADFHTQCKICTRDNCTACAGNYYVSQTGYCKLNCSEIESGCLECDEEKCYKYRCNNERESWSRCNNTESSSSVVIEIEPVKAAEIKMTEIVYNIEQITGLKEDEFIVGLKTDENGYITEVIIYIENEETAKTVEEAMVTC